MQERPRIGNDWSKELTKGKGRSIAAKLQTFSTADEVIDWSVDQYRALGLAGLALAFSYVANNPGQVISENHELTFNFKSAVQKKPSEILKKIKVGMIVNLEGGLACPVGPENEQQVVVVKDKRTITLADKTNPEHKEKSTAEELTDNLTVSLCKKEGEKTEQLLIQKQIKFLFDWKQKKYIPLLNLDIRNVEDIKVHRKELKQILVKLDPSLRGINNSSKSDEKESKLMILQYLEAFEKSKLNDHYNLGNNLSPKKIYSELKRMFSKIIKENYISTSWSYMADQSGESIIHKLIYVLQNSNDLKQQHISYTQLFILLTNYLYIDGLRELELVNRLKKERGK